MTERRKAENKDSHASAIAPVIDAMDLMHSRTLNGVVMVGSDGEFERLVQSLRNEDLKACGLGKRKVVEALRQAFQRYEICERSERVICLPPPALIGAEAFTAVIVRGNTLRWPTAGGSRAAA